MSGVNRIVIGHVTPFVEYSPHERQRLAAELVRRHIAKLFVPVQPEKDWRPYEPCKEDPNA